MPQNNLPISPVEASKLILEKLSSRRSRDVVAKRFGLKGGRKYTLEAVGKEYKITRERVRQIEEGALKALRAPHVAAEFGALFGAIEDYIKHCGEVMAEHHLFSNLCDQKSRPHLAFIMAIGTSFTHVPEDESFHTRWTVNKDIAPLAEKVVAGVVADLKANKRLVSLRELETLAAEKAKGVFSVDIPAPALESYLKISKLVKANPYGEYGLSIWPNISPRGVRDKAHAVLAKFGKPMHFREVAGAITKAGWQSSAPKKKAHPQTVHNELIKDDRFVLVGRGMYALREWGYEEGTVREVIARILSDAHKPLGKEELVARVLKQRAVKVPTILLNLQNSKFFKRTDSGGYTLV